MKEIFIPIKPRKISDEIVEQLRSLIFEGKLKPGERLPPERELANTLNVSRVSLRESLNTLQGMGLLEIQQGNRTFVRPITTRSVHDPLVKFMKTNDSNGLKILEVRKYIEIGSVSLAARRATPQEIHNLSKILQIMEEDITKNRLGAKTDIEFHTAIAEATHNELYIHIIYTIYDLLQEQIRKSWGGVFRKKEKRKKLFHQHMGIFEGIKEHDPRKGEEQAAKHFDYVNESWENSLNITNL